MKVGDRVKGQYGTMRILRAGRDLREPGPREEKPKQEPSYLDKFSLYQIGLYGPLERSALWERRKW